MMALSLNKNVNMASKAAPTGADSNILLTAQRLATGLRINKAKDAATGLAVSDDMVQPTHNLTVDEMLAKAALADGTEAALRAIKDADYAVETNAFSSANVLQQAGIATLAQANQQPDQILTLLPR